MPYQQRVCPQTLLNLSVTSRKTVRVADDKIVHVRTINPVVMVMSEPAITILMAMCELGIKYVSPDNTDNLHTPLPGFSADIMEGVDLEPRSHAVSSVCSAAAPSAGIASAIGRVSAELSPSWSANGEKDSDAFEPTDGIEAAHLAACALAQIAEDDWCREPLVQVPMIVA